MDWWRGVCCSVIQVEAKLELRRIRHEAGMPRRVEHDFNMNFRDTGQPPELALHVGLEHVAHAATRSRQAHLYMNPVHALLPGRNDARVNQTQVHTIER